MSFVCSGAAVFAFGLLRFVGMNGKLPQKLRRGKNRNAKCFKILFVSGNDAITPDGFGAGGYKAVLKVFCFLLECSENIIVGNAADLDDLQQFSDCLICEVGAVCVLSHQIVDVCDRGGGDKAVNPVTFTKA